MRKKCLVVAITVAALLAAGLLALGGPTRAAQPQSSAGPTAGGAPLVRRANKGDVSAPLASLPARVSPGNLPPEDNENAPPNKNFSNTGLPDQALQRALAPAVMPGPMQNFDGMYNQNGPIPPDTNGAVGRNEYIQIVNSMFQIFGKAGASLYGPTNINTLWTGFGGVCETFNNGDPIALYDPLADRWMITQFNFVSTATATHQCIAISTSPNPLGSWYRYDFTSSPVANVFEDYPHLSVWPDAYYMTTNEFPGGVGNGGGNFAFNRIKMLQGDPTAEMVYFHSAEGGMLSSGVDGLPPPAGSPNYFMTPSNGTAGTVDEYKFSVNFATPNLSTFLGPFPIPVTPWNDTVCSATRGRCIQQPGTTAQLETLAGRFMYRLQYRNMGSYESLVVNHTVNATGGNPGIAGVRWYEFRAPNGVSGATVFQQGTYAPADNLHRWMGSAAMDHSGDIAVGFSTSSATQFPAISYAGRLVGDPLGQLSQGEAQLLAGGGSEDFPAAPRWGDYSALTVDPADDCTYWFTTEYFSVTGLRNWRTRIGSFKFPSCAAGGTPTAVASATGTPPTATNTPGPSPTFCPGGVSVTGAITNTDPTQTGRLGLGAPVSTCAVPKPVSALSDSLTRHYRSYTYTNNSGSAQCVTVSVTQACGNNAVQSIAYLGSYDPTSIQTNYLADGGAAGASFSYSFSLGAGQTAVVVMAEVSPNLGCAAYTVSINPCAPPVQGTPTATSTGLAATATRTTVSGTATATRTTVSGTATATAVGGTATATAVGGTPTASPISGTPTATVVAATATSTAGPPSATATSILPTLTIIPATGTLIPATGTVVPATGTVVPATQTPGGASATPVPPTVTIVPATQTPGNASATPVAATSTPSATTTPCTINFSDVHPGDYFYTPVLYLYCHGVISGYADGTFRPYAQTTRSQMVKIVVLGFQKPIVTPAGDNHTFADVPTSFPFFAVIETAAASNIVSGYTCGGPGEPCDNQNRPYFRPYANVTRGQLSKIDVVAAGWALQNPPNRTFTDVLPNTAFYEFVETAACHGVISGYTCGGPGEPCDTQGRPYFRQYNPAIRGQIAKIVYLSITSSTAGCPAPTMTP